MILNALIKSGRGGGAMAPLAPPISTPLIFFTVEHGDFVYHVFAESVFQHKA